MDERVSRGLFWAELIALMLPLSWLALVYVPVLLGVWVASAFSPEARAAGRTTSMLLDRPELTFYVLLVLAPVAVFSGWRLAIAYLRRGAAGLRTVGRGWWFTASLGLLPCAIGAMAWVVPSDDDPYSPGWVYLDQLQFLVIGWLLAIPLLHLWLEKRRRSEPSATPNGRSGVAGEKGAGEVLDGGEA